MFKNQEYGRQRMGKNYSSILKSAGFRETLEAYNRSVELCKKIDQQIRRFKKPPVSCSVNVLGSLGQGLIADKSDVDFFTLVTAPDDNEQANSWTHELSANLIEARINVEPSRQGVDALNQEYIAFEGSSHCIRQFMKTQTTGREEKYMVNLVPLFFYSKPVFETKPDVFVNQKRQVWHYIQETKHEEDLSYLYYHLISAQYSANRNNQLKYLKLKRDKTVRSIISLHLALFDSKSIGELKTPPMIAIETLEGLRPNEVSDLKSAYPRFFDNYFKLRAAIIDQKTNEHEFDENFQIYLASEEIIRNLSLKYITKRGWHIDL